MQSKADRLQELFQRYVAKLTTPIEEKELMQLLVDPTMDQESASLVERLYEHVGHMPHLPKKRADKIFNQIVSGREGTRRIDYRWWAVAAAACLVIGSLTYFAGLRKGGDIAKKGRRVDELRVAAPKLSQAVITLATGKALAVDSASAGAIANEAGAQVEKTPDGALIYHAVSIQGRDSLELYHTLINPRGSKPVSVTLSDGSKILLNSESSIRYPILFRGPERIVEITGEAYFEVQKLQGRKFLVKTEKSLVEVLGTHFNVNAYLDEKYTCVTLLEGSVQVKSVNNGFARIKPGEQAIMDRMGTTRIVASADVEQAVGWVNNKFVFAHDDISTIMRQVARWYNITFSYEGDQVEETFSGTISRYDDLSEVLDILSRSGLQYKISGHHVTIKMK